MHISRDARKRQGEWRTSHRQKQSYRRMDRMRTAWFGPRGEQPQQLFLFPALSEPRYQHSMAAHLRDQPEKGTKPNHQAVSLIGFSQVCALLSLPSVLALKPCTLHLNETFIHQSTFNGFIFLFRFITVSLL